MKKINLLLVLFATCTLVTLAQRNMTASVNEETKLPASKVDYDAYELLVKEVKEYRKDRLVSLKKFVSMSKEKKTIIVDTRSAEMYNRKHVKGAVNLNFSDFTEANLRRIIPATNTKILIYCNNNFDKDPVAFATKFVQPKLTGQKEITLALNIPTFINLYGYGYKNVYELGDLVSVFDTAIEFEGTDVIKIDPPVNDKTVK